MSLFGNLSLLWPRGEPGSESTPHWQGMAAVDLGLEHIVHALNFDGKHERDIRAIVLKPCQDGDTIRYRQEIIDDLLRNPELARYFSDLLPLLSDLTYYGSLAETEVLPFQKTLGRIGEMELYIEIVNTINTFLNTVDFRLQSAGLRALRDMLQERQNDPIFEHMQRELPKITVDIRKLSSITLGINLDHNLKPIGATLVSINTEPFRGSSFFNRLFGDKAESQGMSQLHVVPMQTVDTLDGRIISTQKRSDPMLFPLFKDLDHVINDTVRPAAAALRDFLQISTQFLAALEPEIVFYLGAVRLIHDLQQSGLPMCRAEVADMEARTCIIHDCYNLNLAIRAMTRQPKADLSAQVIGNDIRFDENGRIFIITGPNQGGKTTYIQAIALAQVLFQVGLYVPGTGACISPVDGIYTHFPVEEKPSAEAGRFGEEAQRLGEIFTQATRYSLILMNESLASTAFGESLYLAQDIVRCLRLLGVRAAYTTHMHELAAHIDELETTPGDSKVVSLVAVAESAPEQSGKDAVKRTYKIIPSPPMGHSYAHELAARYGISYDKIVETLAARHVIPSEAVEVD